MEPNIKDIEGTISAMVASASSAECYLEVLDKKPSEMVTANFLARKAAGYITAAARKAADANQSAWRAIMELSEVEHPGPYEICQRLWLQLCVDMTAPVGVDVLDSELTRNLCAPKDRESHEAIARIQAERIITFYLPCTSILNFMLAPESVPVKEGSFSEAVDSLRKLHASCEALGEGSTAEVATSMLKIESGLLEVIATMYEQKKQYREKSYRSINTSADWYGTIADTIDGLSGYIYREYHEMTVNTGRIPSYEQLESSERPSYWLSEDHMARICRIKKAARVLAETLAVAEEVSEKLGRASTEKA